MSNSSKIKSLLKANPQILKNASEDNIGAILLLMLPLLSSSKSVKTQLPDYKNTLFNFWKVSTKTLGSTVITVKGFDIDLSQITPKIIGKLSAKIIDLITSKLVLLLIERQKLRKIDTKNEDILRGISYIVKNVVERFGQEKLNKEELKTITDAYIEAIKNGEKSFPYAGQQYSIYIDNSPIDIAKSELERKAKDHKSMGELIDEFEKQVKSKK